MYYVSAAAVAVAAGITFVSVGTLEILIAILFWVVGISFTAIVYILASTSLQTIPSQLQQKKVYIVNDPICVEFLCFTIGIVFFSSILLCHVPRFSMVLLQNKQFCLFNGFDFVAVSIKVVCRFHIVGAL